MGLYITKTVSLSHTPDDWDLYDEPGVEAAAAALNRTFELAVNAGHDRETVLEEMWKQMKQFSSFGCTDSEPCREVDRLLEKVFGT